MQKVLKIIWKAIIALTAILFLCWLLIQTPAVQTFIAHRAVDQLEGMLNGKIGFSKVQLSPFNALVLKDVTIIDNDPATTMSGERLDTILRAKSFVATFTLAGLLKNEGLHIKKASLTNTAITLTKEERGSNLSRFIGDSFKSDGKKKNDGNVFDIRRLSVKDLRFRMIDPSYEGSETGVVDMNDLDVLVKKVSIRKLKYAQGVFSGNLEELMASEKSGYSIEGLSAKLRYSGNGARLTNLRFNDGWTELLIPEFSIEGLDDIKNAAVKIDIRESRIESMTLASFLPQMKGSKLTAIIDGIEAQGTLDDINISKLSLSEQASGLSGSVKGHVTGLPELSSTKLNIEANNFILSTEGIQRLMAGIVPKFKGNIKKFAPGETFRFNGKANGLLNDLRVDGKIDSGIGKATANLKIKNVLSKGKATEIGGSFSTTDLDAGKIAGIDKIGKCTLHGSMSTALDKEGTKIKIDSLLVDKFSALGYDYSNIVAAGTFTDKAFDGRLACNDPNLNLLFQGLFTISDKTQNGLYKFYANLGYADLNALHLDKRGTSKVSGQINANYMTIEKSDVIGDLDIIGLTLENDEGRHDVGDICVTSHTNNSIHRINLKSDFATGNYVGTKSAVSFFSDLQDLTTRRDLPVIYKEAISRWNGDEYGIKLNFHESSELLSFVKSGLYIADSTQVSLNLSKEGQVKAYMKSPRLALGKNYIKDMDFVMDNDGGSLNGALKSKEISAAAFKLLDNTLSLFAKDDRLALNYTFDNHAESSSKGELHLSSELGRSDEGKLLAHIKTLPSSLWYDGEGWNIPVSKIEVTDKGLKVEGLEATNNDQVIRISGGFSSTDKDTLNVDISQLDLDFINNFIGKKYGVAGKATGHALISSPWKTNPGLLFKMACDSTVINDEQVGTLMLGSSLDDGKIKIMAKNDYEGNCSIDVLADYFLKEKTVDAKATLDNLNAAYLEPMLRSVFSDVAGSISGTVTVKGKTDDLKIRSHDTRLDNSILRIAYTNVPYWCDGTFSLTDEGLFFDDMKLRDKTNGTGRILGGIKWDNFKKIRMDTKILVDKCQAISLSEYQNSNIYGDLIASGTVNITGPLKQLLLDIDARTDGDGNLHIPLDKASKDSKNELLTFKVDEKAIRVDPYEAMLKRLNTKKKKSNDLSIRIKAIADQATQAFVELDRSSGNTLSGRGHGNIDIDIKPNRHLFALNGDYTLDQGTFKFNAMDIAQRTFTISNGSNIRFNGDIMDSDLNLTGLYNTKASIATLISDTTSVSTRRLINCGVDISGKLREPQLSFSISVPDLDPTTKSKVESALNTDDKVQRQFLALLISGSFVPDETSGIVNNSAMIYSNVAEIMAGQLNNILQKLDIPLDLGLNYQASDSGSNIFDVAVSTQLFNNRVLVNGAVGNRDYGHSGSQSDVAGDLDIEIKLDKSGRVLMNLFSHSADDYSNYLDNTQRSGVGIAYQKEFSSVKELLHQMFTGKKKRAAEEREFPSVPPEREVNTVTIKKDK